MNNIKTVIQMGRFKGKVFDPEGYKPERNVFDGFSWPCLFLGFFWFALKDMWLWCFISFLLMICTFGAGWFIMPFFANSLHMNFLKKRGYLFL